MIIPLVGVTSVGKTSLLKALTNTPSNDESLGRVSGGTNTTQVPTIVRWKTIRVNTEQDSETEVEIFLLDLPGVHGTATAKSRGAFMVDDAVAQLGLLEKISQVCCVVMNDAVDNFAHNAGGSPTLDGTGALQFEVGAERAAIGASQVYGAYSASFNVTVAYQ